MKECWQNYWSDLRGDDAKGAFKAICALAAAEQTPDFLQQKLNPAVALHPDKLSRLIADLEAPRFSVSREAQVELKILSGRATAALKTRLQGKPSLALGRRIEELLAKGDKLSSAELQTVRAIEALERAGTPAAKDVLGKLAKGAAGALETIEARVALERLRTAR